MGGLTKKIAKVKTKVHGGTKPCRVPLPSTRAALKKETGQGYFKRRFCRKHRVWDCEEE